MTRFEAFVIRAGCIILWGLGAIAMVGMAIAMSTISYLLLPIPLLIFVLWTVFMYLAIRS